MVPTWFDGPGGQPVFAWIHAPEGGARAVVVLWSPLGAELIATHRAMRLLAQALADRGLAVLRFDYLGTGDSADPIPGDNHVDAWLDTAALAVAFARDGGATNVVLVGLRMGATLASAVAERCGPLAALVLWDPCESGAGFLRAVRALGMLGSTGSVGTVGSTGTVEGPGTYFDADTAIRLRSVDLRASSTPLDTLVLARPDRSPGKCLRAVLRGARVVEVPALDQHLLLDVSELETRIPVDTIGAIVTWLDARIPFERVQLHMPISSTAVVAHCGCGDPIIEHAGPVGPSGLFAITTEPCLKDRRDWAVLFTNTATTYRVGVGRSSVDSGRHLAALGFRSVRFDLCDVGDSPEGDSLSGPRFYSSRNVHDVVDTVAAVAPRADSNRVIVVGLCSGAWATGQAARRIDVGGVCLVNPLIWNRRPLVRGTGTLAGRLPSFVNAFQRLQGHSAMRTALGIGLRTAASLHLVAGPAVKNPSIIASGLGGQPGT